MVFIEKTSKADCKFSKFFYKRFRLFYLQRCALNIQGCSTYKLLAKRLIRSEFQNFVIKQNNLSKNHINPLSHELIVFTDIHRIRYPSVFEVADYESEIRFSKCKMADPIWRTSNRKFHQFFRYLVFLGFWGRC